MKMGMSSLDVGLLHNLCCVEMREVLQILFGLRTVRLLQAAKSTSVLACSKRKYAVRYQCK